ncbi:hypothetical protein TrLO_g10635 [Triparma laevis f. longispina]|uniref:Uncharacterized protein n=1 Tax=Triparma laevis f. longispina TaxID=1714387 RepID=A0A9W7CBN5_9STRA|nr:hypothetical protein TrLO_g10635 [Triparma laevis f. longispina]
MCAADAFNEVEGSVTCDKYGQYMLYNQTTKNCFCLTTFILQPDDTCSCKTGETLMGTTCQSCETAKWKAETGVTSCNLYSSTLQFSTTKSLGSTSNSSCICPSSPNSGARSPAPPTSASVPSPRPASAATE